MTLNNLIPDKIFIKKQYKEMTGKNLNLKNPKSFNEKLNWLKIYNRKKIYTTMVDKYEAKEYVKNILGKEYVIPTIGVYEKFDDIDFDKLPNQFVMKCTHDSGGLIICKNKKELNIENARKKINKSLKNNYYYMWREWPYKNIKPRIIIEEYKEDKKEKELIDYKVYAFNGKTDYLMACFNRFKEGGVKFIFYDKKWKIQKELSNDGLKYGDEIKLAKPKNLDKMFEFSNILSKNIPFVRVDFYEVDGQLYFGELTFFPSAGYDNRRTDKLNKYLDEKLIIGGIK